jgi:type IV secretory pathway VirB10-like protein
MAADELIDDGELEPEEDSEQEPTGGGRFSKLPLIAVGLVVALVVVIGAHGLMVSNRIESHTATPEVDDEDAQNRARLKALEVPVPAATPPLMPQAALIPQQVEQPIMAQQPRAQRTPSEDEKWRHDQLMLARQAQPLVKIVHDHSTLEVAQTRGQGDIAGARTGAAITLHPPAAPYSVMAGSIVPALLINGINSDIPGQIVAQVSQNVFDTATGKSLLIPQGSRLIGDYGGAISGVPRIRIDFKRLILPDTSSKDLPLMPGGDQGGYAGITGDVNNHYAATFGTTAVMALIGAAQAVGTMAAFGNNTTSGPYGSYQQPNQWATASQTAGQGATIQFSNLGTEMARRGLNRPPTIVIPPGALINVIITADLQMPGPYRD